MIHVERYLMNVQLRTSLDMRFGQINQMTLNIQQPLAYSLHPLSRTRQIGEIDWGLTQYLASTFIDWLRDMQ